MADSRVQPRDNGSREQVAMELLKIVADIEGKRLNLTDGATREWVLDTYAECLWATTARRLPKNS